MSENSTYVNPETRYQKCPRVVCPLCEKACHSQRSLPCEHGDCPCETQYGVICVNQSAASFGEADAAEMCQILECARDQGWRDAVEQFFVGSRTFVKDIILDTRRSIFSKLLDLNGIEDVLDIGCGYGGVAIQLSENVRSVVALDITLERVALLETIRQQENIDNILAVCNGDILSLPFEDNQFDVISLIGVLEYFPLGIMERSPWQAHVASLRHILRKLKPGGKLVIGTKNRYGWHFLMGQKDHNHIPFGPVLPLGLANWLCKMLTKKPYRIVSYSFEGYRTLLVESGFSNLSVLWPIGGYQKPNYINDFGHIRDLQEAITASFDNRIKRSVLSLMARAHLLKFFAPNFLIVARKPEL